MFDGFIFCSCMIVSLQFIGHHLSIVTLSRYHSAFSRVALRGIGYGLFGVFLEYFTDRWLQAQYTGVETLVLLLAVMSGSLYTSVTALFIVSLGKAALHGLNEWNLAEMFSLAATVVLGEFVCRKWTGPKLQYGILLISSLVFLLTAEFLSSRTESNVFSSPAPSALMYVAFGIVSFMTRKALQRYRWKSEGGNGEAYYQLTEMEERYYRLVEQSPDPIIVHSNGIVVFLNKACTLALCASDKSQLLGHPVMDIIHPDLIESIRLQHQTVYETGETMLPTERTYVRLDGQFIVVEASASLVSYMDKPSIQVVFRDITARKSTERRMQEANEQLSLLSQLDGLTGIDNRRSFDEQLDREWKRCARNSFQITLILFDIDQFKPYNDTYGHLGGDQCLREIASTLLSMTRRPGDFIARYGGEEFAILLPETELMGAERVAEKVRRLVESLQIPHIRSDTAGFVTVSLGVASMVSNMQTEPSELIRSADIALYRAKEQGRNRVVVF